MNEDLQKKWVGGICKRDEKVLLIHRINKERLFNQEYFVFPGKAVEDDESTDEALHESFQELGLIIQTGDIFYSKEDIDEAEYFYTCIYSAGEILLPEVKPAEYEKQFFTPMWVPLSELDELMVHPESIKELLLEKQEEVDR